jgi:hypothetical protein
LVPRFSGKTPSDVEHVSSSSSSPLTDFTVQPEVDWTPSEWIEAADAGRRERLRQILTNVHATETPRAPVNDVETALRNSLGNAKS